MLTTFNCPVCKDNRWKPIENYFYSKQNKNESSNKWRLPLSRQIKSLVRRLLLAKPRSNVVTYNDPLSSYQRLRLEVLFNVWFKESQAIELTTIYCETCGFSCYSPRPDDNDIAEKYMYLNKHNVSESSQKKHSEQLINYDQLRAEKVYQRCSKFTAHTNMNILDYGGASGNLLIPFRNNNHNCYIIDYDDTTITGVTKLGNSIHDALIDKKFDLIIFSHVLEHVSDLGLVDRLREHLQEDGIIYVEVPQEIWAGIAIESDPVTHINFFTLNSLLNLLTSHGFEILKSEQEISNYGASFKEVIWAIAKNNRNKAACLLPADTKAMLYPSRLYSLKKLFFLFAMKFFSRITPR